MERRRGSRRADRQLHLGGVEHVDLRRHHRVGVHECDWRPQHSHSHARQSQRPSQRDLLLARQGHADRGRRGLRDRFAVFTSAYFHRRRARARPRNAQLHVTGQPRAVSRARVLPDQLDRRARRPSLPAGSRRSAQFLVSADTHHGSDEVRDQLPSRLGQPAQRVLSHRGRVG